MSNSSDFIIENGVLKKYVGPGGDVVIPEGVTEIGGYAFFACKDVVSVTIPDSVVQIGPHAFDACSLKRIRLTDNLQEVGPAAFDFGHFDLIIPHWTPVVTKAMKMPILQYIHTEDITKVPSDRRFAAIKGLFAEGQPDISLPRVKNHADYLLKNANRIKTDVIRDPELLRFMCDNKLIKAGDIDTYLEEAGKAGDTPVKALLLQYQNTLGKKINTAREAKERTRAQYENALVERTARRDLSQGLAELTFVLNGTPASPWKSQGEIKDYLSFYGAALVSGVTKKTDYIVDCYRPDIEKSEKLKKAEKLGVPALTIDEFNEMVGKRFPNVAKITVHAWMRKIPAQAFRGRDKTKQISIPESVTDIEEYAFSKCGIRELALPEKLRTIGDNAFFGCEKLISVSAPQKLEQLGNGAFWCCSSLKEWTIPEGVLSIGEKTFCGCRALENISIPETVEIIKADAFNGCAKLKMIRIPNKTVKIGERAFDNCPKLTIHAPAGSYAEQYAKENNIPFVAE